MANDSVLSGLTVSNTTNLAGSVIGVNNVSGATIANSTLLITGTSTDGSVVILNGTVVDLTVTGNTLTAISAGGMFSRTFGLQTHVATSATNLTISGNSFDVTGANVNEAISGDAGTSFVTDASIGNVLINGSCTSAGATGFVSFTDGTTCGP